MLFPIMLYKLFTNYVCTYVHDYIVQLNTPVAKLMCIYIHILSMPLGVICTQLMCSLRIHVSKIMNIIY